MTYDEVGLPVPWGIVPTERLFRVIRGEQPAVGANVSIPVPGGVVWSLLSFRVTLVTDANVANRQPFLVYSSEGVQTLRMPVSSNVTAGINADLNWLEAPAFAGSLGLNAGIVGALTSIPLLGGSVISTLTNVIQVGDQYGVPILYVAEFEVRGLERALDRYLRHAAAALAGGG